MPSDEYRIAVLADANALHFTQHAYLISSLAAQLAAARVDHLILAGDTAPPVMQDALCKQQLSTPLSGEEDLEARVQEVLAEDAFALIDAQHRVHVLTPQPLLQQKMYLENFLRLLREELFRLGSEPRITLLPGNWESTILLTGLQHTFLPDDPHAGKDILPSSLSHLWNGLTTFASRYNLELSPLPTMYDTPLAHIILFPGSDSFSHPFELIGFPYDTSPSCSGEPQGLRLVAKHGMGTAFLTQSVCTRTLETLLNEADEAVIISHVPPRFSNRDPHAVDWAEVYVNPLSGAYLHPSRLAMLPQGEREQYVPAGNSGSRALRSIVDAYQEKILAWIAGHFHESGGHAHDLQGKPVSPGVLMRGLFLNASSMRTRAAYLITLKEKGALYTPLPLSVSELPIIRA